MDWLRKFNLLPHSCSTVKPGDVFGRLTVLAIGKPQNSYRYTAICQCNCGSQPVMIRIDGLTAGSVISCKCYHREQHTIHGLTQHPLFLVHHHMTSRCNKPTDAAFERYGGRGITVCKRWLNVVNFVADMEAGYQPGLTIERIDNNKGYSRKNCRWATRSEQADNRRTGRYITFNGKTQSMRRWAEETGINEGTLRSRFDDSGWSVERALTTATLSPREIGMISARSRWNFTE